jgi:hypothetical protein
MQDDEVRSIHLPVIFAAITEELEVTAISWI